MRILQITYLSQLDITSDSSRQRPLQPDHVRNVSYKNQQGAEPVAAFQPHWMQAAWQLLMPRPDPRRMQARSTDRGPTSIDICKRQKSHKTFANCRPTLCKNASLITGRSNMMLRVMVGVTLVAL